MFNLLPQQDRRELLNDYRLRFAVAAMLLFGSLGIIALVALAPSFLVSYQKEVLTQKNVLSLQADIDARSKDHFSDILAFTAQEVKALGAVSPTLYTYELVEEVIHSKTEEIKITGIQVTADKGGRDITVTGQARDRDALLSFVRILEQQKVFAGVTVPVSNFAAAADINFSVLIKAK